MNKNKEYTKMILQRLNKKIEDNQIIKDPFSNQKTQATPNHLSSSKSSSAKTFFQYFQNNVVTIHQPVIVKWPKPHKRSLYFQLCQVQYKVHRQKESGPKDRMYTVPTIVSQFNQDDKKISKSIIKQNKSSICVKRIDEKTINCKTIQNNDSLMRYKSLKTIPNTSSNNYRRVLVYPISQTKYNEVKDNYYSNNCNKDNGLYSRQHRQNVYGFRQKEIKIDKKKNSPRKYLKKCQSYQKYMIQKGY